VTHHRACLSLSFLFLAVATVLQAQQPNAGIASTPAGRQAGGAAQVQRGATGADWPSHGGTNLPWRYSALNQISTANVKKMVPVWTFQTGDYSDGLETTPIAIDGVVYISTA
jgi:glucose dehydrogenase